MSMKQTFDTNKQLILSPEELAASSPDIGGRDIIIGFNEPAFKISEENHEVFDSKLNARFATYFAPAVIVAKTQKKRPRLILSSGINAAFKWNAASEQEKKIMVINNNLKFDFLKEFFSTFFPDTFSIIECVVSQDQLKMNDEKLFHLWKVIERKYPDKMREITVDLARFNKPQLFNSRVLSPEAEKFLKSENQALHNSFKYAIAHLFALGDINFEGNIIHNPVGYLSIGGHQEKTFNLVRSLAFDLLREFGDIFFERVVVVKDNLKLVIEHPEKTPPPYNGFYRKKGERLFLDEVTYENGESLDFYTNHKKLKKEMEFFYQNFVSQSEYAEFWEAFRPKYIELKKRYREAYQLENDF